jgi:hypothetical protein
MKMRSVMGVAAALCTAGLAASAWAADPNDNCANAIALTVDVPATGTAIDSNTADGPTNSTTVNGCTATFFGATQKSVWFTFTPAVSGLYEVTACPSVFDSVLAIYPATSTTTGSVAPCTGSVAAIACNDDSCGTRSNFNANLTAGQGYIIRFAQFSTGTGAYSVMVHGPQSTPAPANDDCANAIALTSGTPTAGDLTNATGTSTTIFTCGSTSTTGNDVWYTVTPTGAGTASVDVCGNFDTIVNVLTAASTCAAPASLACNDDTIPTGCTTHGSRVTWTAVANTTYRVRVAGVQPTGTVSPAGSFAPAHGQFTVTFTSPAPTGSCCNFNTGACTVVTQASCGTAGSWTLAGVCSPDPCPKSACCNNVTGACTTGGTQCAAGLTYQGPNSVCSPTPCPATGSCCYSTCCIVTVQGACQGVWTAGGTCAAGSCTTPVANDNCSAAIGITVGTSVTGSNCGATLATGEPAPTCQSSYNASVWYSVTPATTGFYDISTCGGTFDSVLSVFTSPDCVAFTAVACDDDTCAGGEAGPGGSGAGTASLITGVQLNGGQLYYVRVAGFSTNTGVFPLLVSTNATAGACCNTTSGACTVSLTGSAGCGAGTTFLGGVCTPNPCPQPSGGCCTPDGLCSVIQAAACTTAGGIFQGPASTCNGTVCPVTVGSCCNTSTGVCTYIVATATCTGGVFTSGGVCSPDTCPKPGTCCISGCCTFVLQSNCNGTWTLGGSCSPNPCGGPSNDLCANATVATVGANPGTNACANTDFAVTPSTLCGTTTGAGGARDVWHVFTPTQSANYTFTTCDAVGFDSVLAYYASCPANGSVAPIACNDDTAGTCAASTLRSEIPNQLLIAGQSYYIRVAAWAGGTAEGPYVLTITQGTAAGACCTGTSCAIALSTSCSTGYQGDFTTCGPNTCDPLGSCCAADGSCTEVAQSACTGTFTLAGTCTPNTCPQPTGACCCGSTCSLTLAAACTGTNQAFRGSGTVCNVSGNNVTPCCKADYNQSGAVSVQDIFDFLAGYFSADACADINGTGIPPTVQDIFDFLAAYFAGCV